MRQISKSIFSNKPNYLDIIFYFLILVFCYFVFNHGDILLAGGSSFVYLNGHIKDFYEVSKELMGGAGYLPSIYILYTIWNIPIKLLGIVTQATTDVGYVIFWYKLLPTLFFAGSAYFMNKIGRLIGLSNTNSILLTMIWISSPILFFSQFVFGQCDIITIFLVLVGLYYYLQKKTIPFVILLGLSFTFKYFSILIFVPLLLLIEKNPLKIMGYLALAIIPVGLEVLFYGNSLVFREQMTQYGFFERAIYVKTDILPNIGFYLFPLIWSLICGICYYLKPFKEKAKFCQVSIYVCMVVSCTLFILVFWHPQWLLFMTPFLAMTTFMSKNVKYFLLTDFLIMVAFVGFTVCIFPMNVDQSLFGHGILGKFNPNLSYTEKTFAMASIFTLGIKLIPFSNMYFSAFSALLILNILFKFPTKLNTWESDQNLVSVKEYWNYARLSFFGGMAVFIIPAFIAYFCTLLK